VRKPDWLPNPYLALAAKRVAAGGVLVSNSIDEAPVVRSAMRSLYAAPLVLRVRGYDNRIYAGSTRALDARRLRAAIQTDATLASALSKLSMRAA